MRAFICIWLMVLVGCVQPQNPLPVDPVVPVPVNPDPLVGPKAELVAASIKKFATAAHREPLRRYSALYAAAADAIQQSGKPAGKVLMAVKKMPEEFVKDRIPEMAAVLVEYMPETGNPDQNRSEIESGFRSLAQGCLLVSGSL